MQVQIREVEEGGGGGGGGGGCTRVVGRVSGGHAQSPRS